MSAIPLFVTNEARRKLINLGWSDTQIDGMNATFADGLIRMNYRAPTSLKDRPLTGKCSKVGKQPKEVHIHISEPESFGVPSLRKMCLCVCLFLICVLLAMRMQSHPNPRAFYIHAPLSGYVPPVVDCVVRAALSDTYIVLSLCSTLNVNEFTFETFMP